VLTDIQEKKNTEVVYHLFVVLPRCGECDGRHTVLVGWDATMPQKPWWYNKKGFADTSIL
jgi:hypothetical protein